MFDVPVATGLASLIPHLRFPPSRPPDPLISLTSIGPPEYFPRAGFAALLLTADRVVLADTLPFSRQAYQNRARIRGPQGLEWLTVPRRRGVAGRDALVRTAIDDARDWRRRHRRALQIAYGAAPYYEHHHRSLDLLLGQDEKSLGDLASATVEWTRQALGATSELVRASGLTGAPDSLADIWSALHPSPQENPPGLLSLPDSLERDTARVGSRAEVYVLRVEEAARRQVFDPFLPGTSALDLILNYGPAAADMLREAGRVVRVSDG